MLFGRRPEATDFRGLVLVLRARTGLLQRELAAAVGVTERTIQTWEAGSNYPSVERLKRMIEVCLRHGAFVPGREEDQAVELWQAAVHEAPRLKVPFDHDWFTAALAAAGGGAAGASASTPSAPTSPATVARDHPRQDWGEAPDALTLHGRAAELETLRAWLLDDRCRLVAVLGLGGIGKTALAASLARGLAASFERVCWRSLRNAPPTIDWLGEMIGFLSAYAVTPPEAEEARLTTLVELLREQHCLLVIDNFETVLQAGAPQGGYREGCDGYGEVLRRISESVHRSCLLVTSREKPPELALLEGEQAPVRSMRLGGLGAADARRILEDKRLVGDEAAWRALVGCYGGNPLALKVVGETIGEVMGSDIATFLSDAGTSFGGIRRLLDGQFERLSTLERRLLTWLAVEREPIGFAALAADLGPGAGRNEALEALEAVNRRSLLERGEGGAVTLQPVVLEYLTDRLVEAVAAEVAAGQPVVLVSHALVKATARHDVRRSQERLIALPILARVGAIQGDQTAAEARLVALLEAWRGRPPAEQGYGPGNVVNLLRLLRGDLRGLNLSGLSIRQAYLQEVDAQDASLAAARLGDCVLADAFDYSVCVALDRDGTLVAAGTASGEVRLWRAAGRTPLLDVQTQGGGVYGIALSADGARIASGSVDGVVRLWESASGCCLAALEGHTDTVHAVALSAEGSRVASASFDGTIRLWDSAGGQQLAVLSGHHGLVWGVALSGDGRLVASCGYDGTVRVWDAGGGCLAVLEGHAGGVWCVALAGNGKLAVSGGLDGTVRVWDLDGRRELHRLHGHTDMVWGVALSSDGLLAASGSYDGTVRLWDTESGQGRGILQGHLGGVRGVALSRDGRLLASGSFDGTIRLWQTATGACQSVLQGHTGMVWGVALSADGQLAASGALDGSVRVWQPRSGRALAVLRGHMGTVRGVALAADGQVLASGGYDGAVRVWAPTSGHVLAMLHGHAGMIFNVALSPDGHLAASAGRDGTARLWDLRVGTPAGVLRGHDGGVLDVALSADKRVAATSGEDGTLRLWDLEDRGRSVAVLKGHEGPVWSVALTADGRLAATAGEDGTVRLWEVGPRRPLATLAGHIGSAFRGGLSGDGRLLASSGMDGTVRLWDVERRAQQWSVQAHTGAIWGMALSVDGRLVASGAREGMVGLWDTATGQSLPMLRPDRPYERMNITGLQGLTGAQRGALVALGAVEQGS